MLETKLGQAAEFSFARHETFAPRFGWLHKAYTALLDPELGSEVFLRSDAPVLLGVGKNMVNAIRHWAQAFKVSIEHSKGGTSRAYVASPTWEARWLLDEDGADPYLEDSASLWLLHWWLLKPASLAPVWWVAFHAMPSSRFTEASLAEIVTREVRLAGWDSPAPASIAKDIDCLTKMYARRKTPTGSPGSFEDLLDCPFRELGLLEPVAPQRAGDRSGERVWQFTSTVRTSLPANIVAYACLDYASQDAALAEGGSIATARLANEPGGPGRAFRIREPEIVDALAEVAGGVEQLSVSDGVGQRSLTFAGNPAALAWDVLDAYYDCVRQRPGFPEREAWDCEYPDAAAERRRREQVRKTELVAAGELA
ncbi:MAG: DUF4007 family protein [Micromonosporaceae bacterium]